MGYRITEYNGEMASGKKGGVVYGIQIRDHGTMGYGINCVGYRRRDIMDTGYSGIRDTGYGMRDTGYGIVEYGTASRETGCRYGVQDTGSWDNGIRDKMWDTGDGIRGQKTGYAGGCPIATAGTRGIQQMG